ncbi:uncharacterized protein PHALS_10521 [Plasmopara halstedii]|uniref:Uncharacterized protein n=1 Tax=Plasmopara halstedii TaxID=4781 RepID=A0A0P1AHR8_PLAHL|nr:uncharacterized protein PHALS_10521 [Plasmopara halstedii]CEG40313.1 hypothetical protein PHALS_10521 [Plasmopara halstedii]|eukprot:XP_024576682.1 hypothetical protein PHALS_10521 [Plasmopara halstedii]
MPPLRQRSGYQQQQTDHRSFWWYDHRALLGLIMLRHGGGVSRSDCFGSLLVILVSVRMLLCTSTTSNRLSMTPTKVLLRPPARRPPSLNSHQLGVVDPTILDERVYTNPEPCKNRRDYIVTSNDFSNAVYGDNKYIESKYTGDHLSHEA